MNTHGSLSIAKPFIHFSKADYHAFLTAASVGVLAGIAVTFLRTPIHLPGHKVIFWLAPALATRLVTRAKPAASISVLATIFTTLLLGGQLAGGAIMMPLVAFAGITMDIACQIAESRRLSFASSLIFFSLAGVAANLLCLVKRLFNPVGQMFSAVNLDDLLRSAASYALCGLFAGLIGALCGVAFARRQSSPHRRFS